MKKMLSTLRPKAWTAHYQNEALLRDLRSRVLILRGLMENREGDNSWPTRMRGTMWTMLPAGWIHYASEVRRDVSVRGN